ncbi:MAG TPA: bacteriohemerythrin [Anaeromyxobacteraceae bacterium]|nr:bacteriohemerythrin [Anaeromyxobacteraceae bacterium]
MRIEWTPALSVGNDAIDAQHRELFRRADDLIAAIRAGKPERVGSVLRYLHEYAVEHFGLEEAWMREHRYKGYVRHKAEHDRFMADLVALAEEQESSRADGFMAGRVNGWLADWLVRHVSGTDAEMAVFLAKRLT